MPKPNRRGVAMATGVAVLATLPYLNTTSNEFVYDDYAQVVRNDLVRSLSPLPSLSEGSVTHGQVEWYRPLTIYSFALNYAFDGLRPFLYHVTNIVLHAANSLLVAALVWRLSRSAVVTVTSAALFAVHAVHTEAVTPVFGRADLLSAFFVLAGWCLSLEGPSLPLRRRFTIALLFVAGLLAKESAVALLAVIVVSDLLRANAPERSFSSRLGNLLNQRRGLYVALGLALTGYTLLRFAASVLPEPSPDTSRILWWKPVRSRGWRRRCGWRRSTSFSSSYPILFRRIIPTARYLSFGPGRIHGSSPSSSPLRAPCSWWRFGVEPPWQHWA